MVVEGLLKQRLLLLILALIWLSLLLVMCVIVLDLELDDALVNRRRPFILPFNINNLMFT
jgi:hypothetical protein